MAPSIAITQSVQPQIATGNYKEFTLGVRGYQEDIEEDGRGDLPKAKVYPHAD